MYASVEGLTPKMIVGHKSILIENNHKLYILLTNVYMCVCVFLGVEDLHTAYCIREIIKAYNVYNIETSFYFLIVFGTTSGSSSLSFVSGILPYFDSRRFISSVSSTSDNSSSSTSLSGSKSSSSSS